jgi:hypothetical protein
VPGEKALVLGAAGCVDGGQGFGAPELVGLGDEPLGDLAGHADLVVVGSQVLGGGVGQDERTGAFGSGHREQQRHRANLSVGHDGGPLGTDRLEDRVQRLGVRLPGRQGIEREGIGDARAQAVEQDQPRERRQPAENRAAPGSSQMLSIEPRVPVVMTRSGGPCPSTW